VAVVHLELLGDALLWLPYGQALVRHLHTEGKQVVLVADAQLERVLGDMLPGCEWLGIPRRGFVRNPGQRWRMLRQLRRRGVAETYLMRYPRDALIQDATVRALAGVAWGFDAVFPDRPILDRRLSRALYEHRIPAQYRTCTSAKDTTHF
jgi:hypothetical protein